ncbi:murein biosynthesis integral membrane protein MurJ [Lentibacillus cibarius]|uniref:Probable lipid II flippase MurJ n=1 Tax=Lentibacillus cibarius TaxID=2583219 RepID=A0A549YFP9_9BACI|nr:murein biosynthesis integral membrane protein MurJ [Lentibacillus cibarius]TRM10719.1 murein biosynthesis integral membrane protein MurJ [Lentibacillus cibarius]
MKSKLGLASVLFIGASLLLKVSGLIRDMVIAYYFGDSFVADAYLAAFIIPNMFILFMRNGMKNAFVPSYIEALDKQRGEWHFGQVFKGTIVISLVIALLGVALAPVYIPLFYPEFSGQATDIAIRISAIFFAAILFIGMNAVLEAFFDSQNRFTMSMISQIIVIVTSIGSAFLFANRIGAYSLAIGYVAGAVIALFVMLFSVIPQKVMTFRRKLDWLEVRQFYWVFIPVGLTVAVGQINLMVGTMFASHFQEGAVTYINYAKNLVHMPQGIFGVTIGTIIFPLLSKAITTDDRKLFKRGIEQGLTSMYLILLPSVIGMLVLMPNIISLLYERGEFTAGATMATTQVAYMYVGSVLCFSLNNIINKGFYSLKKGHLILIISSLSILLNMVLNFILTAWIGYRGIPLAASLMAFGYVGAQFMVFYKLVNGLQLKYLAVECIKITAATGIMAAVVYPILQLIGGWHDMLQIIVIALTGAIVYFISAYVLHSQALRFLLNHLFKKKRKA